MANIKPANSLANDRFTFFQQFLKHPLQVGSVIPSSRFLERRIMQAAGINSARTIVELGSGTGGTTRAILRTMPQDARLLSIEINPRLHKLVSSIKDNRLIAHLGSACDLSDIISMHDFDAPDTIVSGIPFSTMNHSDGSQIIEAISSLLSPDGRFVAYQLSKRVTTLCRPYLGAEQIMLELFNIPPMYVYTWDKKIITKNNSK